MINDMIFYYAGILKDAENEKKAVEQNYRSEDENNYRRICAIRNNAFVALVKTGIEPTFTDTMATIEYDGATYSMDRKLFEQMIQCSQRERSNNTKTPPAVYNKNLSALERRISGIEHNMVNSETMNAEIDNVSKILDNRVSDIKNGLHTKFESVSGRVDNMNERFINIGGQMESVDSKVNEFGMQMNEMNSKFSEDVKQLSQKLNNNNKMIEMRMKELSNNNFNKNHEEIVKDISSKVSQHVKSQESKINEVTSKTQKQDEDIQKLKDTLLSLQQHTEKLEESFNEKLKNEKRELRKEKYLLEKEKERIKLEEEQRKKKEEEFRKQKEKEEQEKEERIRKEQEEQKKKEKEKEEEKRRREEQLKQIEKEQKELRLKIKEREKQEQEEKEKQKKKREEEKRKQKERIAGEFYFHTENDKKEDKSQVLHNEYEYEIENIDVYGSEKTSSEKEYSIDAKDLTFAYPAVCIKNVKTNKPVFAERVYIAPLTAANTGKYLLFHQSSNKCTVQIDPCKIKTRDTEVLIQGYFSDGEYLVTSELLDDKDGDYRLFVQQGNYGHQDGPLHITTNSGYSIFPMQLKNNESGLTEFICCDSNDKTYYSNGNEELKINDTILRVYWDKKTLYCIEKGMN